MKATQKGEYAKDTVATLKGEYAKDMGSINPWQAKCKLGFTKIYCTRIFFSLDLFCSYSTFFLDILFQIAQTKVHWRSNTSRSVISRYPVYRESSVDPKFTMTIKKKNK